MTSIQEPEVQFAQRLACNEKPIRTKAVKKLRKYINVRSQKATGGFTGDELLKLWKGLFYCLWMQDKPLLQEEISNQISTLIHSFQDIDGQLLYLESFLQTFKREWTGIDRLRMDKFFQLVRFMFRQTFELLKRRNWDSSVVGRFLDLLTAQLLQSGSAAPSGLQFHILDLYMTELAAVGSAELTAEQNLIFIEPFCKTAAKTKDRVLFRAIYSSIFSTIIDQAPFAIDDLMKEVKAHEESDSDSGQASEEEDEDGLKEKKSKSLVNGCKSTEDEREDADDEDDDFGHLEDSDTELPRDEDMGPVLQFDYSALADKLFELSSRSSTPSHNRQKLYRIIKVLRDLSEGIFPQDEYPEEVSTDEDDDMFGSRKRMKRAAYMKEEEEEEEEGVPAAKKRKGKKKEASALGKQNDFGQDDDEEADPSTNNENKKKKRKKKKKAGLNAGGEENTGKSEQGQAVAQVQSKTTKTEGDLECSQEEDLVKETHAQSSISSVKVTEAAIPQEQSKSSSKKKKKRTIAEPNPEVPPEADEEQHFPTTVELEVSAAADVSVSAKKKKRKSLKAELQTDAEAQITPLICEEITTTPLARKKNKGLKAERKPGGDEVESQTNGLSSEDVLLIHCEDSAEGGTTTGLDNPHGTISSAKKKSKKKSLKVAEAGKLTAAEIISEASQHITTVLLKEKTKKKGKQEEKVDQNMTLEADADVIPLKKKEKRIKRKKNSKITVGEELAAVVTPQGGGVEKLLFDISLTTPAKNNKSSQSSEIKDKIQSQVVANADGELPVDELDGVPYSKKPSKKKRKIPVVFEYEADELEATAQNAAEKKADAQKTNLGIDVGHKKKAKRASGATTDFITFQSNITVPTPLFCKTKGSPSTPLTSKKRSQTPKSESKKVTFGLKNNKTAEFRKSDRSLLVSPDGSSRVPFDPKQKPKFGVLKSPPTPFPNRKMSLNTPKSTPKRRPSAADFF